MANNPHWCLPSEAAEMLGVHTKTLTRWPGLRFMRTKGGHRRYLREDVVGLLNRPRTGKSE